MLKELLISSSFSSNSGPDIDIPPTGSQSRGTTASFRTIGSGGRKGTVSREGLLPPGGRTALPFRWHSIPTRENGIPAAKWRFPTDPKALIDAGRAAEAIRPFRSVGGWARGGSGGQGPYWFAWRHRRLICVVVVVWGFYFGILGNEFLKLEPPETLLVRISTEAPKKRANTGN